MPVIRERRRNCCDIAGNRAGWWARRFCSGSNKRPPLFFFFSFILPSIYFWTRLASLYLFPQSVGTHRFFVLSMPIQRTKRKMKARSKIEKCVWMFLLLCWYFNDIRETSLGYNWQAMLLCRLFFFFIVPSPQKNRDALLSIRLSGSPCVAWWLSAWLSLSFLQWRKKENEKCLTDGMRFKWENGTQHFCYQKIFFLISLDWRSAHLRTRQKTGGEYTRKNGGANKTMNRNVALLLVPFLLRFKICDVRLFFFFLFFSINSTKLFGRPFSFSFWCACAFDAPPKCRRVYALLSFKFFQSEILPMIYLLLKKRSPPHLFGNLEGWWWIAVCKKKKREKIPAKFAGNMSGGGGAWEEKKKNMTTNWQRNVSQSEFFGISFFFFFPPLSCGKFKRADAVVDRKPGKKQKKKNGTHRFCVCVCVECARENCSGRKRNRQAKGKQAKNKK